MKPADRAIPGPSHGKRTMSEQLGDLVYDVWDGPSEPDPYKSVNNEGYQVDSYHDSDLEHEFEENDEIGHTEDVISEEENMDEPPILAITAKSNIFPREKSRKQSNLNGENKTPTLNVRTLSQYYRTVTWTQIKGTRVRDWSAHWTGMESFMY